MESVGQATTRRGRTPGLPRGCVRRRCGLSCSNGPPLPGGDQGLVRGNRRERRRPDGGRSRAAHATALHRAFDDVRRVPSTKAIATGAVPHQTAGAPRTPHRPRPDRTRRRAASRPTAGTRRRRAGIRRRGDREVVQVGGDVSSPVGRLRRPTVLGTLLGSGGAAGDRPSGSRRSSNAVTAAVSPSSLPQSSTGRFEMSIVEARS